MLLNFQGWAIAREKRRDFSAMVFIRDMIEKQVPGPGKYKDISNLSAVGKYVVSSHRGGTKAKFDKFKRIHQFEEIADKASQLPGPGRYQYPS